jgi:hypothetical protein
MPAVKILPGQYGTALHRTAPPRLLVGIAAVALLTAGCASSVPGEASPEPGRPSAQSTPSPSGPPGRAGGTCQVRVSANGSISSSGAGGRTVTTNGRTSFSCGRGPLIAIESIAASGVTFSADGATVTVAPGASDTVGAYRISVSRADADGAEFQVEPG